MKKFILAAICCISFCFSSVSAQNQGPHRGPGMGEINPQLADTTITNRMRLTDDQRQQINVINENFSNAIKSKMQPNAAGAQPTREELIQRMNEMLVLRQQGYQQLRQVLGTEDYITYLENALMRASMRPAGFGGGRHGGGEQQGDGQRRRGRRGQGQQPQMPEGFDGGMPPMGGGFGDDNGGF